MLAAIERERGSVLKFVAMLGIGPEIVEGIRQRLLHQPNA